MVRGQWANLAKMPRSHLYSFWKTSWDFLMTTESQDLGLTSHLKDDACWQHSVHITILGCWDPHRQQGEHLVSLTSLPAATSLVLQGAMTAGHKWMRMRVKLIKKHHNNPQVTHTTPVHQLTSCEEKSCMNF